MRSGLLLIAVLLFIGSFAVDSAADDRRGFCSGGGFGVAPVSKFSFGSVSESATALGVEAMGGYGFTRQDVIALEWMFYFRGSDYLTEAGRDVTHLDGSPLGDQSIVQFLYGAAWYHYFSKKTKSLYAALGAGMIIFGKGDFGQNRHGSGWLVGAGYAFSESFQAGVHAIVGQTKDYTLPYDHVQISFTICYIKR
jgi:hypothetical protein